MYPHDRGSPGGHYNDERNDANNNFHPAFADYTRRNLEESHSRPNIRHHAASPSNMSRRVTSATARMPSMRSMLPGGPTEPTIEPSESAMPGVAVGTMYESSEHSSHFSSPSNVANLPNAPYQQLMQHYARENPPVHGARVSPRSKHNQRPYPQPGRPQEPTTPAIEPNVPPSRLGRRMLARKIERKPDFVVAEFATASPPIDSTNVECITCQAALEIPKSVIVILCPNCDQIQPAASCRVVR